MISILITGINGFLGSYFKELSNQEIRIFGLSRSNSDFNFSLDSSVPVFGRTFELVIHAAGLAHTRPKSQLEFDLFYKVNVIGTENLLNGLKNSGIPKKFVLISSVAVYGKTEGEIINESAETKPIDPYGKSKIEAEKIVINWCKENNVVCTILRLPLVLGFNPPGNLGAMINGIKNGFYFDIAGNKAKKSMVLASDVAKFIFRASDIGGIYNLTDGFHPTFSELSFYISRQLGSPPPKNLRFGFVKILANVGDLFGTKAIINSEKLIKITSNLTFDDSKARKAFGWAPIPVLEGFRLN